MRAALIQDDQILLNPLGGKMSKSCFFTLRIPGWLQIRLSPSGRAWPVGYNGPSLTCEAARTERRLLAVANCSGYWKYPGFKLPWVKPLLFLERATSSPSSTLKSQEIIAFVCVGRTTTCVSLAGSGQTRLPRLCVPTAASSPHVWH